MVDWTTFPKCDICIIGGIAANDCPNCRHKINEWYMDTIKRLQRELSNKSGEFDKCRTLLTRIFSDPGPVSENDGAFTEFAYFWRKDWLKLKAEYEAAVATNQTTSTGAS